MFEEIRETSVLKSHTAQGSREVVLEWERWLLLMDHSSRLALSPLVPTLP